MKKILLRILPVVVLLFAAAGAEAAVRKETPRNAVEVSAVENGGEIKVNLKIEPQNGWQIYSHNPGDIGLPTKVKWKLHDHRLVSEEWSEGEDIIYEGYGLNVYRRPAAYAAVLAKAGGEMPDLEISWMACNGECVPESLVFKLTPEVFAAMPAVSASEVFTAVSEQGRKDSSNTAGAALPETNNGWLEILLLAFAGGVVLNFMPCVFPILFIKIMSVTKEKDRRRNVAEAFQYAAGVLSCFAVIAAVLAWLRRGGAEIGWGFQLQSPYFVAAMALLFFLLALMFLNVIKFNWSLKYLPAGSFMTGLLAVLIASPCTAPFMGAAVGWAITTERPAYFYYPVFLALGAGYALPFFLAGIYPAALQKILPRPGKWMEIVKKLFALPMLMTCGWLLWVLWSGAEAVPSKWEVYQPQKVETVLKNGEKVLINFTAKWCITCLVNEKTIFSGREFARLVKKHNVRLFKADWTNRSPEISRALAAFGRSSIPLYVYYDGKGGYQLLPQLPDTEDFERLFNGK